MNYGLGSSTKDDWVCPNDRQLRLRAKLQTGWSVKAGQLRRWKKPEPLDPTEQEKIEEVIKRAEALDYIEQERVGRLVERVDNMKRNVTGGAAAAHACALCGDKFSPIFDRLGLFGAKCLVCHDCRGGVCQKCGIESVSASKKENIWLCKICAETREMWKKSNAWFFKVNAMDILNGKLEDVLDRCRKNCYSSDQLKIIFSPLSTYLDHHTGCSKGPPLLYVLLTSILLCLGSAGLVMFWHEHLSGWGAFYYNAIAYGVISKDTLVRHFGHGCFLPNPYYERPAPFWPAPEDCHLCEATESVDTVNNVTFENVKVNYLDRGRPLIVTCAMDGWDSTRRSVDVEDVAELYLSAELSVTPPCYLDTNLNLRHALDMKEFVKIQRLISTSQLDKWFIQWQNCKMAALRKLRLIYRRFEFWDPSVSPEHASWVLMSANYNARNYKTVELGYGLIMVLQIRGSLEFLLSPHSVCHEDRTCISLTGTLQQGQALIFTNLLWTFDYIPHSVNTTSISIITETYWN